MWGKKREYGLIEYDVLESRLQIGKHHAGRFLEISKSIGTLWVYLLGYYDFKKPKEYIRMNK